jgi:hypothetical protein
MFNPKPRAPTISVKAVSTAAPSIMAKSGAPRPANGPTVSGLHKAAIFNASKSNLSNGAASEKPDFKTPAAKIRSPAPVKMAEKVVSSPMFPEIPSDEEDYLRKASEAGSRPEWAATPALRAALMEQQNFPTDRIFDKIQPVRLEGIQAIITIYLTDFLIQIFSRTRRSSVAGTARFHLCSHCSLLKILFVKFHTRNFIRIILNLFMKIQGHLLKKIEVGSRGCDVGRSSHPHCHRQQRQVQAEKVQTRM